MYRKILIALEDEDTDAAVLAHVQTLVAKIKAEATLLRVVTVADDGGGGLGRQFQTEIGSSGWRRKNEAETYLSELECQLQRKGLSVETALVIGTQSEGDEIVAYAAQNGFDLIVMASTSQPWYKRLICDPQDDDVLRKATVPTLFVNDGTRKVPTTSSEPETNKVMAILGNASL